MPSRQPAATAQARSQDRRRSRAEIKLIRQLRPIQSARQISRCDNLKSRRRSLRRGSAPRGADVPPTLFPMGMSWRLPVVRRVSAIAASMFEKYRPGVGGRIRLRRRSMWRKLATVTVLSVASGLAADSSPLPATTPPTADAESTPSESVTASDPVAAAEPADAAADPGAAGVPAGGSYTDRTALNLLGQVNSSSGESRRNENVDITLIDNNVQKELNIRMGTTATIVRSFDADKGYFGAEFGGPPTGQIHLPAAAKASGFHGNIHETHNNSVFSARSFFQVGGVKPARTNDYGFQLGAPLWSGGHFTVDGNQQKIRGNVNGNVLVPAPDERTPLATDPQLRAFVSRILDSFPDELPNRPENPRALNTNAPQQIDGDSIGARFDQAAGEPDALFFNYRFNTQKVNAFQLVKGQNPDTTTRSHNGKMTWNRTWSARTSSDVSAGFQRVTSLIVQDESALGPLIYAGRQLEPLGGRSSIPFDRAQNQFRYAAMVRHTRGAHLLTGGAAVARDQLNGVESSGHTGMIMFSSDFGRDTITNVRLGTPSRFTLGIGNTHRGFRRWRMQYFIGDQWRATANLTLNLGVRYEPVTTPIEVNGLSEIPYGCDCNNFAPRFGFAYRAGAWGVFRGAYGLHYGEIFAATYSQERFNPPQNIRVSKTAPDLLDVLAGLSLDAFDPNARSTITRISPDLVAPYSHQYNFSWELAPAKNWTLRLGYLGSRTHRLLAGWPFNRARAVPGIELTTETVNDRRPDPRFFDIRHILNGSRAYYDAAKASLTTSRWHGLSMDWSYWFSKAIDLGAHYASNAGSRDAFSSRSQSEFEVHGDVKGLSNFDQPHASSWRLTYETPRLGGAESFWNRAFGRWELFSVVLLKTGTPFGVRSGSDGPGFGNVDGASGDRPDILDPSILGRSIDHPDTASLRLPRSAFAFIQPGEARGNLARNAFRKDGIRNVNFAVSRSWKVAGEKTLTFRAESINFLNTPQFARPGGELSGTNFGEITNTLNDGRTFRFLLRFGF